MQLRDRGHSYALPYMYVATIQKQEAKLSLW